MAKFSLKSFMNTDIIYIAPVLVLASFIHVFSKDAGTHNFGQIEIYCALGLVTYYLWDKIAAVYSPEKILAKRIEGMVCAVVGMLLLFLPFPPLMTWQYYNLYKNSDRLSLNKQILAAVITLWLGVGTIYGSFYLIHADQIAATQNSGAPAADESSYVAPIQGK